MVALPLAFAGWLALPATALGGDDAQATPRAFDLRVDRREVAQPQRVLRATEGDRVELRWTVDEPLVLHLHGYDIETRVAPGKPAVTAFTARLTGRFPVAIHATGAADRGRSSDHHSTLLYLEVYPR